MTEEEIKQIKQLKVDICQTFGTEAGGRVLKWLESTCFRYDTTYRGNRDETLINEGTRRVLISLENLMALEVDELIEKKGVLI